MSAVAIFFLAASLHASPQAAAAPAARIGPDAVFSAPHDFLASLHAACDAHPGDAFGECFLVQMKKAGASPAALSFARQAGNQGYLADLREAGKVDVAKAVYPFRANTNEVWFLVNGKPPMIDVGEVAPIEKLLEPNSVYRTLRLKNPKVLVFPRDTRDGPRALPGRAGQRFAVQYELKDCHACMAVGYASVAYAFDASGAFQGAELGQVKPFYH